MNVLYKVHVGSWHHRVCAACKTQTQFKFGTNSFVCLSVRHGGKVLHCSQRCPFRVSDLKLCKDLKLLCVNTMMPCKHSWKQLKRSTAAWRVATWTVPCRAQAVMPFVTRCCRNLHMRTWIKKFWLYWCQLRSCCHAGHEGGRCLLSLLQAGCAP